MGDTVGLVSNLCLGAGRVVVALARLVVPVCTSFLAGKDLKLGLGAFLAGTCCVEELIDDVVEVLCTGIEIEFFSVSHNDSD